MTKIIKNIFASAFYISIFLNIPIYNFAQDSSHIRISLLTCTPGEELYSTFGHSALRVVDSSSVTDIVYNYGTFSFNDNGFYLKFIRGKLMYFVSTENFEDFIYDYQLTNRGITEQVLNFSAEEKIKLQHALNENIKEENKYYKYDFFLDNCTTRLRDLIVNYSEPPPTFKAIVPKGTRFRQAIHEYLDRNGKYWSKLGIDILMGAPTDIVMTISQSHFLPDYLMKALDSSHNDRPIVLTKKNLYPVIEENRKYSLFTPTIVFSSLLVVFVLMAFSKNNFIQKILQGFDGLLFFLTGILGIIIIFMWTCTDHGMCKNNFNLLWAWPTHSVIAFFVNSKKNWVKKYFGLTAIALMAVLLCWFFLPQQMNNDLIPFLLILIYRSAHKSLVSSAIS